MSLLWREMKRRGREVDDILGWEIDGGSMQLAGKLEQIGGRRQLED
jgi:hypothetical protein